ncbi:hypothetical protein [Streptomyces sp. NPDC007205]|uniref:hypothetical protein n=1 Tax=Streptomyces sp. NPDC007205 TaxID=3154316 RepID=UPI0033FC71F6
MRDVDGLRIGRNRITRLMRAAGLVGVHRRTGGIPLTRQDWQATAAPDLIGRDFTAAVPNARYVGDITYLPVGNGQFLYLAMGVGPVLKTAGGLGDGRPHAS